MRRYASALAMTLVVMIGVFGCDNDPDSGLNEPGGGGGQITDLSCLGCHSDEDMLKANLSKESVDLVVKAKDDG